MQSAELVQHIAGIDRLNDPSWSKTLERRKIEEIEFANQYRDKSFQKKVETSDTFEKFYGNRKFYRTTARSRDYVNHWVKSESPGRVVLDYACGIGTYAMMAAENGAELGIGFDISDLTVRECKENAARRGLENVAFFQGDAEATGLPDNSIDRIICSGMLHHIDLNNGYPEMHRILKPGGKVLAVEALDYNPAIKLYRMITPEMRTEWEKAHILSLKDVRFARKWFDVTDVRYWHVVGYGGAIVRPLAGTLDFLDRAILERIPLLNRMAWTFTFELTKRR